MALRGSIINITSSPQQNFYLFLLLDTYMSKSNLSQKGPNLETSTFNNSNFNLKKSGMNSIPVSGILKNQTKSSSLAASCEFAFKKIKRKKLFIIKMD